MGQIELADQTARAEGGKSFSQLHELSLGGKRSFLRLMMASAGPSQELGGAVLLEAAQPLADGRHGGSAQSRSGLDVTLFGATRRKRWL